jgi:GTP-binding protein
MYNYLKMISKNQVDTSANTSPRRGYWPGSNKMKLRLVFWPQRSFFFQRWTIRKLQIENDGLVRSALRYLATSVESDWLKPGPKSGRTSSLKEYTQKNRFVDKRKIEVKGGNGGRGSVSFAREPNQDVAAADGGDGGKGGDVVFVASREINHLGGLHPSYNAPSGSPGSRNAHGRGGSNLEVVVPVGTVLGCTREVDESDQEPRQPVPNLKPTAPQAKTIDLDKEGDRAIVALGGKGGWGNRRFKSSTNRSPKQFGPGEKGEAWRVELELKLLADVGLVGYPNAGKSSLLAALTRARPKVANYAFTTVHPNLGMVAYEDGTTFSMADLPGIIEGAHQNKGLGLTFLRHIERTRLLCYVLDISGQATDRPVNELDALFKELYYYLPALVNRPAVVVANKIDLPGSVNNLEYLIQHVERLPAARYRPTHRLSVVPISAKTGQGMEQLAMALKRIVLENSNSGIKK